MAAALDTLLACDQQTEQSWACQALAAEKTIRQLYDPMNHKVTCDVQKNYYLTYSKPLRISDVVHD